MKYPIYFIILIFCILKLHGQSIEISRGIDFYYSFVDQGGPNVSDRYLNNSSDPIFKVKLAYTLPQKIRLGVSYCKLDSWAHFELQTKEEWLSTRNGGLYNAGLFLGSSLTDLHWIGLGIGYQFDFWKDRIKLIPNLFIINEIATQTARGRNSYFYGDNGRYQNVTITRYSNPGFQIIPEFNGTFQLKIYKGLHLQLEFSYFVGHRPSMYIEVDFEIEGVKQPLARNYSNGTGFHGLYGLTYYF